MNYKYWMVHGSGTHALPPAHKHTSLESAQAEAIRLAEKHAGEAFFVLESVKVFATVKPVAWEHVLYLAPTVTARTAS